MYYSCILKEGDSNIEGDEKITLVAALEKVLKEDMKTSWEDGLD